MKWPFRSFLLFTLVQAGACVSHQHAPDSGLLVHSAECDVVNGHYSAASEADQQVIAGAIFGAQEAVETLEIRKSAQGVFFLGTATGGQALSREIPQRHSCKDSVLTVVLADQGSTGAAVMSASDTKLELFAVDDRSLNLRFIDSDLTFIFIVPTYSSDDYEVILHREAEASAN